MHVFHVIFFARTHDGKFSLGEHPVFSKEEKGELKEIRLRFAG